MTPLLWFILFLLVFRFMTDPDERLQRASVWDILFLVFLLILGYYSVTIISDAINT